MSRHFPALRKAENRFFVAPNGGIPDALRDAALEHQSRPSQDRRYGIYVGSLSRRKNADGILKASVRFLMSYPDMRFVIIGASSNVFETLDVDIPVEVRDRLEMRGQINDPAQIYDALSGARFLLFPSFFESSGLPPMEAMTFGCPVIASDIASLNERCGDAALYCDPDDQEDIANKIQCLMDDDALWSEKSSAGKLIAKTFSWASQARKLLELSGCRHE